MSASDTTAPSAWFRVGNYRCHMTIDASGRLDCEWRPHMPRHLGRRAMAQYRSGRDALLREWLDAHGGGAALVVEV